MSGLAGLLAGHFEPGIYTWHAAFGPEEVQRTVEHAGARFAYVDGWAHQSAPEFVAAAAEALGFPDWFDQTLDAFADCLDGLDVSPIVLLWDGWGTLARSEPETFSLVLEILAGRTRSVTPPFSVLLRGAGPEIAVDSLDTQSPGGSSRNR